jgi:hypothetical protein
MQLFPAPSEYEDLNQRAPALVSSGAMRVRVCFMG